MLIILTKGHCSGERLECGQQGQAGLECLRGSSSPALVGVGGKVFVEQYLVSGT